VIVTRFAKLAHDPVALRRRGVDGHEVVVVEVDAPCAHLGEQAHDLDRRARRPDEVAERIAPAMADGPETEGELVLGTGKIGICSHDRTSNLTVHAEVAENVRIL
jgi:hypothetical protein